jgi:hypothetical protein
MSCSVQNNVKNVVSAKQHIAIVGEHLLFFILGCAFQQDVHVSVDFYHFALVLAAVLEDDLDVSVELLDEDVKWLLAGFHDRTVINIIGMHNR